MGNCIIFQNYKIGESLDCYWKVDFYSKDGTEKLSTEYVQNGNDCTYGKYYAWSTSPNQNVETVGILNNVTNNLTVYVAFLKTEARIPAMTSATTPSGTVIMNGATYEGEPYTVFGQNGLWVGEDTNSWIGYEFQSGEVYGFEKLQIAFNSTHHNYKDVLYCYPEGRSNGVWENCLKNGTTIRMNHETIIEYELNGNKYDAIRFRYSATPQGTFDNIGYGHIQLLGSL